MSLIRREEASGARLATGLGEQHALLMGGGMAARNWMFVVRGGCEVLGHGGRTPLLGSV